MNQIVLDGFNSYNDVKELKTKYNSNPSIFLEKLAEEYKYRKLPMQKSVEVRQIYRDAIPDFLYETGRKHELCTRSGLVITNSYDRIVVGDYGAFVEFTKELGLIVQKGQEYRLIDPRYSKNVKYIWLTAQDNSGIKIYWQRKTVDYADYKPNKYYVSVHEIFLDARN